jgi:hypothetical protein
MQIDASHGQNTMSQISAADSDRFLPDRPVVFRNATVLTID